MGFNEVAWNMVLEQQENFKKLILPLKKHLGIDFGYMIVFNDGRYFQIIENLECLQKWVTNVETSHIFCARNVTTYFDEPYNFTIWPELPTTPAMEIYKEYGIWNGITVSKINKNYTELYWFTKQNAEDGWHKWFIRNKLFLTNFIKLFNDDKEIKNIFKLIKLDKVFKMKKNFDFRIDQSDYQFKDKQVFRIIESQYRYTNPQKQYDLLKLGLSKREIEVLMIVGRGYNTKIASERLMISQRTVRYHIEQIKNKLGLKYKAEIIQLFEKNLI